MKNDKILILNGIKSHYEFKKDKQFANFLGISPQTLSSWYSRNTFDFELVYKKCEGISAEYLFTGKGGVFKSEKTTPIVVTVDDMGKDNIVLVDVKAAAGYVKHLHDPVFYSKLPATKLPGARFKNGTFRAFQVEGSSMTPTLRQDYWIIGSRIEGATHVKNDYVYVIVTKEKVMVKRCLNRIKERKALILKSDNRDVDSSEVSVSDIVELWYGVAFIGWDMRSPVQDVFSQLDELNDRVTLLELANKK